MNIKQISLFSLIFIISGLSNTIIGMDLMSNILGHKKMHTLEEEMITLQQDAKTEALQNEQFDEEETKKRIIIMQQELEIETTKTIELKKTRDSLEQEYIACLNRRKIEDEILYFFQFYTIDCGTIWQNYHNMSKQYDNNIKTIE
ncbi:MAG TPA: hypothetical protein VL201_04575, partial [Patescibacteria group bacterium]|nr:hypothetical protein [Patescibacteria group bacterium]